VEILKQNKRIKKKNVEKNHLDKQTQLLLCVLCANLIIYFVFCKEYLLFRLKKWRQIILPSLQEPRSLMLSSS